MSVPIIHVGFGHSGTTSLQENIFRKRIDIFYAGIPYAELGGIFTFIKLQEPEQYDQYVVSRLCEELIFLKIRANQRLIISDETLVEQPTIPYTPPMMPLSIIARRLRASFGPATILFTLRNQFKYVVSNYLVLKRNCDQLANHKIEPFDVWFAGNGTLMRNLFLRNLDPYPAIAIFQREFGESAVNVLPLELLTSAGTKAYLETLGSIIGMNFTDSDCESFVARNVSPSHSIVLTNEQRAIISGRSAGGNVCVAARFSLPLREYGYPWPLLAPSD